MAQRDRDKETKDYILERETRQVFHNALHALVRSGERIDTALQLAEAAALASIVVFRELEKTIRGGGKQETTPTS